MLALFTTYVCDICDPPKSVEAAPFHIDRETTAPIIWWGFGTDELDEHQFEILDFGDAFTD